MSAQHTPGPWTVVAIDWAETGNARFEIKGIRRTGMADARLIAAAPSLYEYAASKANFGDNEALKLLEMIHGGT